MRRIDELFTSWPFLGLRSMTAMLRAETACHQLQARAAADAQNRDRGARAEAPHQQARAGAQDLPLSVAGPFDRAPQPGPVRRHHLHSDRPRLFSFVAVMDWASRAVLAWRLSTTMDMSLCVDALQEAFACFVRPEIFNADRAASSPAPPSPAR